MVRDISKLHARYYLPLTTVAFWAFSVVITAAAGRLADTVSSANSAAEKILAVKHSTARDAVHNWRIRFAADHGVADPASLAAAVRYSPMANLLISVAIEESRGDPAAVGSAGEQGAWQVK
ncbi:MAG: transglycosylase SLT domain-containing protein, partial [Geobacteraceae bacterium]|nr:transglycosylase SLT domain-containing protein [Geobacteraceae bacterium]